MVRLSVKADLYVGFIYLCVAEAGCKAPQQSHENAKQAMSQSESYGQRAVDDAYLPSRLFQVNHRVKPPESRAMSRAHVLGGVDTPRLPKDFLPIVNPVVVLSRRLNTVRAESDLRHLMTRYK